MTSPRDDGPPRPPWEQAARRRDRGLVIGAVIGAVVLGVPLGLVAWNLSSTVAEQPLDVAAGEVDDEASDADPGDGGGGDRGAGEVPQFPTVDLGALSGADEVYGRLFTHVGEAENVMVATQLEIAAAVGSADDPDPAEVADALADAAGAGQRGLQELRTELTAPVEDPVARGIRDTYLTHLDAWTRFFVAIEDRPEEVLGTPDGDTAFASAIRSTGEDFADAVEADLPADLDPEVTELVDAIIAEGFSSTGGPAVPGESV